MTFLDDLRRRLFERRDGNHGRGRHQDRQRHEQPDELPVDAHALVPAPIPLDSSDRTTPRSIEQVVLRSTLIVVAVVLGLIAAAHLVHVIVLAFVGAIIAAALVEPVGALERRTVPTPIAIAVVYLVLLGAICLAAWLLFPPLIDQLVRLVERLPPFIEEVGREVERLLATDGSRTTAQVVLDEALAQLSQAVPSVGAILSVPFAVLALIGNLGLALTISALLIVEREPARRLIRRVSSTAKADLTLALIGQARLALATFIRAQFLIMASVGIGTGIGMLVLGVPFVLPLAVLAFVAVAIPFVGPYISGIPIVAIAALQSPTTGLLMFAWILVLQQIQGYVLLPAISGRVLQVSPLVVLLAVLAGAALDGVVGALLAVPLAALGQIVAEQIVLPLLEERPGRAATPNRAAAPARRARTASRRATAPPRARDA